MVRGIAVMGLNGAGKSTLAHALAEKYGFFEMDVEDYYFPEQRKSRRRSLENRAEAGDNISEEMPFSKSESKEDVQNALLDDMRKHPKFVLAGVTMNWCDEILSKIEMAFWIQTPKEERMHRIQSREEKRFGSRVLKGGDLFEQQAKFREMAKNRDVQIVEESAQRLKCPVVVLDGMQSPEENIRRILEKLK